MLESLNRLALKRFEVYFLLFILVNSADHDDRVASQHLKPHFFDLNGLGFCINPLFTIR